MRSQLVLRLKRLLVLTSEAALKAENAVLRYELRRFGERWSGDTSAAGGGEVRELALDVVANAVDVRGLTEQVRKSLGHLVLALGARPAPQSGWPSKVVEVALGWLARRRLATEPGS